MPNIPCPSTPVGKSESDNVVIKEWGEKPNFDFEIKDHLELNNLDLSHNTLRLDHTLLQNKVISVFADI